MKTFSETVSLPPADASSLVGWPLRLPCLCYEDVIEALIRPLPPHLIEVRPGATTRDKKKAIALAYYDWRIMVNRLNRLIGGKNWYADLQAWGEHKLFCTLTILGVPKMSSGEGEADDENGGTSAEQQAKKRAFAEHGFNYLYLLPQVWGEYDAERKRFVNPQALVEEMYSKARIEGVDLKPYISSAGKTSGGRASTPTEPTAETDAPVPPINDKVLQGIRKLCEALGKSEPDYSTLNPQSAQQLLNALTNEYKVARARKAAASDPTH